MTNEPTNVDARVLQQTISDHLPILVNIEIPVIEKSHSRKTFMKVDYNHARRLLLACQADIIYHTDVNTEFSNLIQILKDIIKNSQREIWKRSYDEPICAWMTNNILDLLKVKDYWYHKWTHNKGNGFYLSEYKEAHNKTVSVLCQRKRDYYSGLITRDSIPVVASNQTILRGSGKL